MYLVLLFLSFMGICRGYNLFFTYPDGIIPTVPGDNLDLVDANTYLPTDMNHTLPYIIKRYNYVENIKGFIYDLTNEKVVKILIGNSMDTNDGPKKFEKKNNLGFVERIPHGMRNGEYILKDFKYNMINRGNEINKYCSYYDSNSNEELCNTLPRCLGFIEKVCIVSFDGLKEPMKDGKSSIKYYEKIRSHRVIDSIVSNYYTFLITIFVIFIIHYYIFFFNLDPYKIIYGYRNVNKV